MDNSQSRKHRFYIYLNNDEKDLLNDIKLDYLISGISLSSSQAFREALNHLHAYVGLNARILEAEEKMAKNSPFANVDEDIN